MKRIYNAAVGLIAALLLFGSQAWPQSYDNLEITLLNVSNSTQTIRANAGPVLYYECYNPNTSGVYLQFYDQVAGVVVGTTTPKWSFLVPANISSGYQDMAPPTSTGTAYSAINNLQVAATTTPTGGVAPTTGLQCSFGMR